MTKQARYVLRTEKRPNLDRLVSKWFTSYTIYEGVGVWQGQKEYNATIVILGNDNNETLGKVQALANEIKTTNKRESVLIEYQQVGAELI